ncbi:multicomponent Na+:H+ antiporter subunit F [Pararhizobium capsulatum DSM 1112]|uniref:Multicomponent Na+:H+ antiporter subunit F n=1 Tax=Pararhizobium capsulatum DSM 1112 TaxID=1121113 RepID=A0ABU0BMU3_9HYPH|nr:cation:proton antiporter [Pararhizobium capsulatum]MDQ0319574.1 multicomponent Na+:H+ antiporter subunit F [Pararhizobium capsulatum DSM 1112]
MTPDAILDAATFVALLFLSASLLITTVRIIRGPTLPDRIVGLDMLVGIAIGMIAAIAIRTDVNLYVDIAIALGLVGFLATVAFARFVLAQGISPEEEPVKPHASAKSLVASRKGAGHQQRTNKRKGRR